MDEPDVEVDDWVAGAVITMPVADPVIPETGIAVTVVGAGATVVVVAAAAVGAIVVTAVIGVTVPVVGVVAVTAVIVVGAFAVVVGAELSIGAVKIVRSIGAGAMVGEATLTMLLVVGTPGGGIAVAPE